MNALLITAASRLRTASHADCGDVALAVFPWQSAKAMSHVDPLILSNGQGCTATKVAGDTLPTVSRVLTSALFAIRIGRVPGLIAVGIHALPPIIRLTGLGIRMAGKEVLEAAEAFDPSPGCALWWRRSSRPGPTPPRTGMGGPTETRLRFLREVTDAIRARLGDKRILASAWSVTRTGKAASQGRWQDRHPLGAPRTRRFRTGTRPWGGQA